MSFADWLAGTPLSNKFQTVEWFVPLVQSIHIVTIGVVFVSSLMIALRVLGFMRVDEPFNVVWERFAPWMWRGLIVMLITGVLLVIGEPVREFTALSFWVKMSLLAVSVVGTALLGRALRPVGVASGQTFAVGAKSAALGLMVLWLAIIFLGRAIAYDVEVWGSLSLHPPG